jgi:UDP-N-acetyl-D-glucosamine/UDP-N-acetyl-D-galactosamine dehydrogenase
MSDERIGVLGMGYVGLPVAVALAETGAKVVAFDLDPARIEELRRGLDRTREVDAGALRAAHVEYVSDEAALEGCTTFIVTVPTPIDAENRPDLSSRRAATESVARRLAPGGLVVYESTVYPGVTESVCAPLLESISGLEWRRDFHVGYSPERIDPGNASRGFGKSVKIIAADDEATLARMTSIYEPAVPAGLHRAPSIAVAEAAKVIENTQRDLNIALMNEFALIFDRLGIPTRDVLEAAGTKWNFLRFSPGLVGGHCIGVDPYYLTARAEQVGYHPEVILAGRRINDSMGRFVAHKLVKLLARSGARARDARVAVLGVTFKEDVPDLRNSRVLDLVTELVELGLDPVVHDPVVDPAPAASLYGARLVERGALTELDALVLAVPHQAFLAPGAEALSGMLREGGVFIDVKGRIDPSHLHEGTVYWAL